MEDEVEKLLEMICGFRQHIKERCITIVSLADRLAIEEARMNLSRLKEYGKVKYYDDVRPQLFDDVIEGLDRYIRFKTLESAKNNNSYNNS
jgi:hypothetical protein